MALPCGQLDHAAQAWVGQTVVIRAIAEPCPWWGAQARLQQCADRHLVLVGAPTDEAAEPLPIGRAGPASLARIAQRLAFLGGLLPPPVHLLSWPLSPSACLFAARP
jgi:hypothetical protein